MTSMGKFRHLSRCTSNNGHFAIIAIDHRANLRASLNQQRTVPISDAEFSDFKQQVLSPLVHEASAVLVDPAYGIGVGISGQLIDGRVGLLSPLEETDYETHPSQRDIDFIPKWSVEKIKRVGGDGVKLLLPYHPAANNAPSKQKIVQQIIMDCERFDIPFFLEPIAHPIQPDQKISNTELLEIVVESAKLFSSMGVDILKLQFPVDASQSQNLDEWERACQAVDNACEVPWALLSAGVDFDTFVQQTTIACQAGASGVIVGRAVWAEAVEVTGKERQEFLHETARKRMKQLANICQEYATPWYERVTLPDASVNWYETY